MSNANTSAPKACNPAVVGLAAFGLTTLLLQFHTLGWVGLGPVIWVGLIFGGLAQMVAGFQEMKTGNNFGYCAFTAYGAFWISLCLLLLAGHFNLFKASTTDVGWFLTAWTLFTAILWVGSLRIHGAMALTFSLLLIGFVLLDIGHFGFPVMNTVAAVVLIGCALSAWYMMARIILNELYGRELLPAGKAWLGTTRPVTTAARVTPPMEAPALAGNRA